MDNYWDIYRPFVQIKEGTGLFLLYRRPSLNTHIVTIHIEIFIQTVSAYILHFTLLVLSSVRYIYYI